jgi:hypothetical protein
VKEDEARNRRKEKMSRNEEGREEGGGVIGFVYPRGGGGVG